VGYFDNIGGHKAFSGAFTLRTFLLYFSPGRGVKKKFLYCPQIGNQDIGSGARVLTQCSWARMKDNLDVNFGLCLTCAIGLPKAEVCLKSGWDAFPSLHAPGDAFVFSKPPPEETV
jgi:hypothetical protein